MQLSMTFHGKPRLRIPADSGARWNTVYGVGSPFQVRNASLTSARPNE